MQYIAFPESGFEGRVDGEQDFAIGAGINLGGWCGGAGEFEAIAVPVAESEALGMSGAAPDGETKTGCAFVLNRRRVVKICAEQGQRNRDNRRNERNTSGHS